MVADDGIFWMCFDDFKKNFISIHIGMFNPKCQFTYLKIHEEDEEIEASEPQQSGAATPLKGSAPILEEKDMQTLFAKRIES